MVLAAAVGVLGLAACGEEEKPGRQAAKATPLSIAVTEAGKNRARLDAPTSVPGGLVEIRLKNVGKAPHQAQLIRVDGDHKASEVVKVVESEGAPIPPWLHAAGGVGTTPPGATGSSTQQLSPGRYYVVDLGTGEQGVQATASLEVAGGGGGAPPSAPASIRASEYAFATAGLKAGRNRVTFENTGKEPHHAVIAPLRPGKTLADVRKFAREEGDEDRESSGPPPLDFEKTQATTVFDGGMKQVTELDLEPGKYALLCFITDRKGGPPHVAKGMVAEATVR